MPYGNKEKQLKLQRDHVANKNKIRRFTLIEFLGGKCARCSEANTGCLQIDHILPILSKRKNGMITVSEVYMDREDIDNLQVLCANCHMIKTYTEDLRSFPNYIG